MDEYVLSIDLADTPSPIVLLRSRGNDVSVVERDSLDLSDLLLSATDEQAPTMQRLRDILKSAEEVFATTIVVAPPPHLITLNVQLPPAKEEERSRAIAMFLEDTLPFAVEEYLFDWRQLPSIDSEEGATKSTPPARQLQEHHLAGAPHLFVRHIVDAFRAVGLEPHVVCPPSAALSGALTYIPPEEAPIIILRSAQDGLYQLLGCNGIPRYQRFVPHCQPQDRNRLSRETLALSLWAKRHLGRPAQAVYTVGDFPLLEVPDLPVRKIALSSSQESLAELAARAFLNRDIRYLLTNLRTGELAINPLVRRLIQFLPSISLSLLLALLALGLYTGAVYTLRESKITELEEELFARVKEILPSTSVVPGQEVAALQAENKSLDQQLSDLSSAITISPIDALTTVFRDLSDSKTLSLTSLEVIGKAVKIKGLSNGYAEIERLENALEKKRTKSRKHVYCGIKKELPPSGRSDKVAFRFELSICNVD